MWQAKKFAFVDGPRILHIDDGQGEEELILQESKINKWKWAARAWSYKRL